MCLVSTGYADETKLSSGVRQILDSPRYKYSNWGILVVDQNTGEILESQNADKMFSPASTTKLFSAASAMDLLGAGYRFKTPVYMKGKLNDSGRLDGDLILQGTGDINMGGRTLPSGEIAFKDIDHTEANSLGMGELTEPDPLAGLDSLARQVRESGIKEVTGDILVDDRLFATEDQGGDKHFILSPIVINDNLMDFTISPAVPGENAKLEYRPHCPLYNVVNKVKTVGKDEESAVEIILQPDGKLAAQGQIAEGSKSILRTYQVKNPADFARSLFIEALKRAGVKVSASAESLNNREKLPAVDAYTTLKKVAVLESPPFSQFARLILKVSHNMGADTLIYLMAVHKGKNEFQEGMAIEGEFLKKAGVDIDSISIGDGEGGVVADKISPRAAVKLLKYMSTHKDFEAYYIALPIMGVDGTLATAASKESPIVGKVRAKTGTTGTYNGIRGKLFLVAKGLAGYMESSKGRKLIFAIYINNLNINDIEELMKVGNVLGDICEKVYLEY